MANNQLGPFTQSDLAEIARAIEEVEGKTGGELVVAIRRHTFLPFISSHYQAKLDFKRYRLTETRDQTGVLLLVILNRRSIELLADKGIYKAIPVLEWQAIVNRLSSYFKASNFKQGVLDAINDIGEILATHVPKRDDDSNELSNEVRFQ